MRRVLFLSALVCVVLSAPAFASPSQSLTFEAPRDLADPARRDAAFAELDALGARALRVVVYWNDVAPSPNARSRPGFDPTDPTAYDWSRYDPIVSGARDRGWPVHLTVSGPVPRWATARKRDHVTGRTRGSSVRSSPRGGPLPHRVVTWAVWNEPNHPQFLMPQYRTKKPESPSSTAASTAPPTAIRSVPSNRRRHDPHRRDVAARQREHRAPLRFLRGSRV